MSTTQAGDDAVVDQSREARSKAEFTDLSKRIRELRTRTLCIEPKTGSALARVDARTRTAPFSHVVKFQLQSASSHLNVLANAVERDDMVELAGYSLIRGALETGATALWLLAPGPEEELVLRSLQLAWREQEDTGQFATSMGFDYSSDQTRIRSNLDEDRARTPGLEERTLKSRLTRTKTIQEVDQLFSPMLNPSVETSWRLCSGLAHGNHSTTNIAMQRRKVRSEIPDLYRASSSWAVVAALTRTSCAVADEAIARLSALALA